MKRLIRMSIDIVLASMCPIIGWYIIGFTVDKDLINVFSLTYPLQFMWLMLSAIFSESTNIYCYKNKIKNNDDLIMTASLLVAIIGGTIFGTLIANVNTYIELMGMDYSKYRVFTIYSMVQLYIQLVVNCIVVRLQYLENNKEANNVSIRCNIVNLVALLIFCCTLKNEWQIAIATMVVTIINVIVVINKQRVQFKINFSFYKGIKYAIPSIIHNIAFMIIFFNGIGSVSKYGNKYLLGVNVSALVTDTQWDCIGTVETATCIDVSKNKFKYKNSIKNAIGLLLILVTTSILMLGIVSIKYNINTFIITIVACEIISMVIYINYGIWYAWLKVNGYIREISYNKVISSIIRALTTIKTDNPYKLTIGMIAGVGYNAVSLCILYQKNKNLSKEREKSNG